MEHPKRPANIALERVVADPTPLGTARGPPFGISITDTNEKLPYGGFYFVAQLLGSGKIPG